MKRIKIMLLSFALLAIVGGALAFKAKFDQTFCYTTTDTAGSSPSCSVTVANSIITVDPGTGVRRYYTTTPQDLSPTFESQTCYTWVSGNSGPTITLSCVTPSKLIKKDN